MICKRVYKFKNLDTHKCYNSSFQERIRPYRAIKVNLLIYLKKYLKNQLKKVYNKTT